MDWLNVKDEIGAIAIDMQSGQQIAGRITNYLDQGLPIGLDFAGVEIYAVPFFSAAIGQLYANYSQEQMQSICYKNLSSLGWEIFVRVKRTSCRYYNDPDYAQRLEAALAAAYESLRCG